MKAILELDEMPENCLKCPLSEGIYDDNGEQLWCVPLSDKAEKVVNAKFLKKREDCPLKPKKALEEEGCM